MFFFFFKSLLVTPSYQLLENIQNDGKISDNGTCCVLRSRFEVLEKSGATPENTAGAISWDQAEAETEAE